MKISSKGTAVLLVAALAALAGCRKREEASRPEPAPAPTAPPATEAPATPAPAPTPRRAAAPRRNAPKPTPETHPAQLLSREDVVLPPRCRSLKIEGPYLLEASIDTDGRVVGVRAIQRPRLSGPCAELEATCIRTISGWRYRPAMIAGRPVASKLTVTVRFTSDATSPGGG